jgi:hypothetical protein
MRIFHCQVVLEDLVILAVLLVPEVPEILLALLAPLVLLVPEDRNCRDSIYDKAWGNNHCS